MANKKIIAVVLAGGVGKRFWPLVTYKSMIPIFGQTILAHTLETLRIVGITEAVVVANPQDAPAVSTIRIEGMTIRIVVQEKPKGMGDALLKARDVVGVRPIFVLNAHDVVDDALFEGLMKQLDDHEALVVGKRVESYFPGGYLRVAENRLVEIVEKPQEGNTPSDLINLVFHYFANPADFYKEIESVKSSNDDVYEQALSSFAASHQVGVVAYNGPWQPLKYPWHLLDVIKILFTDLGSYKGKNVQIKKNVVIEGPVYIEDNVKIFENTKIVGPCYIGKNTIIGNNTIIRESHIGADSVIGFNCDVTRSYLGDNCWLHSNYVGDSVLEGNISMGAGANLANLRLDDGEIFSVVGGAKIGTGKNKLGAIVAAGVRIGINASIMPGVKIGKNTFIGSGVVLEKDLLEDSYCVAKPGYTVKKNTRTTSASREDFKKKI